MGSDGSEKRKVKLPWEGALVSVIIHILLLGGAAGLTVLVIQARQPVMFEGRETPSIPARKLEHTIRVKQMQKQMRKPQILQRMVAQTPSKVALPDMPDLKPPDMQNLRDTLLSTSKIGSSLGGGGGDGEGAGRGLTGGTGYSDTRFFGENVRTRAICILMDISQSIIDKGVLEDVRRESIEMLEKLNPATKFNVIVFVDGAMPFSEQMVFGLADNKEQAVKWLNQNFNGRSQGNRRGYSGSTPSEAIKMAVEMGCDTMFILTDDPPYLKKGTSRDGVEIEDHKDQIIDYAEDIETTYGRPVRINTICYKPWDSPRGEEAKKFLKRLSRKTGGRFKLVKR